MIQITAKFPDLKNNEQVTIHGIHFIANKLITNVTKTKITRIVVVKIK